MSNNMPIPPGQIPGVARSYGPSERHEDLMRSGANPPPITGELIIGIINPRGRKILRTFLHETMRSVQQHTRLPSHQFPPYKAIMIDVFGSATIAAGATEEVVGFEVRTGHRGVIRGFGQAVDGAGDFANATWILREGNKGKPPYAGLKNQIGTLLNPWTQSVIHIAEKKRAAVFVTNTHGSADITVHARLIGWYYPLSSRNVEGVDR